MKKNRERKSYDNQRCLKNKERKPKQFTNPYHQ